MTYLFFKHAADKLLTRNRLRPFSCIMHLEFQMHNAGLNNSINSEL